METHNYKQTQSTKKTCQVQATKASKLHTFLYALAAVLISAAFFSHYFLPNSNSKIDAAYSPYITSLNKIDSLQGEILRITKNNNIVSYSGLIKDLHKEIEIETAKNEILKSNYAEANQNSRIFGYTTWQKFMWSFGIGIIIFVLAIEILISARLPQSKHYKKYKTFLGLTAGTIGGYFIAWVFIPSSDLPTPWYIIIMLTIGILSTIFAYYLSKLTTNYTQRIKQLKGNIAKLISLNVNILRSISPKLSKRENQELEKKIFDTYERL
ncbi:hypothetical protein [Galbibacter sp. BG1]